MAGNYIEGVSKVLSGVYTLIKAAVSSIGLGERGVVAYPFTADWGPVNKIVPIANGTEFNNTFNGANSPLTAKKIYEHGYKGRPQLVLAYRMASIDAKPATVALQDDSGQESIVLETIYPTNRRFTAIVRDSLNGGKVIEIVENGVLRARVEGGTLAQLVQALNGTDYVKAVTTGSNLPTNTAGAEFIGGNNGGNVSNEAYQNFLEAVEGDGRANTIALDGRSDENLTTLFEQWTKRVREEGLYVTFVNGGPGNWDNNPDDANTKSKQLNHRAVINVGNGVDGYTAADMAIYVAARAASVALNRTLTDEPVNGYGEVNRRLTQGQRITAKQAGTLIFVQRGDVVLIDEGINTLTVPGNDETAEMGKIRVNNTLDQIARDLEAFGLEYKRSRSNTQEARETYAATIENDYLAGLAAMEVIQPGFFYRPDPQYHGQDAVFKPKIDEAFFHADITPVDSMERIYQKINVNF